MKPKLNSVKATAKLVTGGELSISRTRLMEQISNICFPSYEKNVIDGIHFPPNAPFPKVAECSITATDGNGRTVEITISKQGVVISDLE